MFVLFAFVKIDGSIFQVDNRSDDKFSVQLTTWHFLRGFYVRAFIVNKLSMSNRNAGENLNEVPKRVAVTCLKDGSVIEKEFPRAQDRNGNPTHLLTAMTDLWTLIIHGKGNYELKRGLPKEREKGGL